MDSGTKRSGPPTKHSNAKRGKLDRGELVLKISNSHAFYGEAILVNVHLLSDEGLLIPSTTPLSLSVTDDANKVYQLPAEFFELSPEEPSLQEGTCSFKLVVREGAPLTGNRMKVRASYQQVEAESDVLTMCRSEISIIKEPPKCWYKDEGGKNNCIEIRAQVKDKASALPRVGVPLTLAILYEVGTAVYSQDILQVQADTRLVTDKTGCAVLKFRIKEVSQRHQGQKFVIKIAPDTKQSPTMNNVAPASTIPTMVLSKRKNRNRHQTAAATTTRGERPPPGGTGYPLGKDHQGQALPRDMSSSPPSTGSGNLIGGNHFQGAGIGMRPTQRLMDGRSPWSEEPAPPMTRDMTPMSRAMAPMTPHMRLDQWGSSALQPNRAPQPPPHSHPPQHANRAHLQHPPAPPPPPGGLVPPPLQGPAPSLPKGATGPLREVFKWTEAVLHLLQVELQWEHVGFEIDSSGVVDYSRPMWRCPICRRCKDMLRPTQQHDEECRLDGLLREYSDRIKAHFQSIKDQLVKDKMGPGGSSNSGRDSNFKGTNNISSLLRKWDGQQTHFPFKALGAVGETAYGKEGVANLEKNLTYALQRGGNGKRGGGGGEDAESNGGGSDGDDGGRQRRKRGTSSQSGVGAEGGGSEEAKGDGGGNGEGRATREWGEAWRKGVQVYKLKDFASIDVMKEKAFVDWCHKERGTVDPKGVFS